MIDPNLPMELDDGSPVTLLSSNHGIICVRLSSSFHRREKRGEGTGWSYSLEGIFLGGNSKTHKVLRNVYNAEDYVSDF